MSSVKVIQLGTNQVLQSPVQARTEFDQEELCALADSIRLNGILQPLTVRKTSNGFELIAGERRLRAARLVGLAKVPCIVVKVSEQQASLLSLIENIQRCDLNFFEEAEGFARLSSQYNMTQSDIAKMVGKQQSTIANKLRLLRLTPDVRARILETGLTERHARALLTVDESLRSKLLDIVIRDKLNVAQTERAALQLLQPDRVVRRKSKPVIRDIRIFINTIDHALTVMKQSGINAGVTKSESDEFIEFSIVIPKGQR